MRISEYVNFFNAGRKRASINGGRDRMVARDGRLSYLLWGNEIATRHIASLDSASVPDEISVSDCGWRTVTTKGRLNKMLSPFGLAIWNVRGQWRISGEKEWHWDGSHTVSMVGGKVQIYPAREVKKVSEKASTALSCYNDMAMQKVRKADGMAVWMDVYGHDHVLIVRYPSRLRVAGEDVMHIVTGADPKAFEVTSCRSDILSAFARDDFTRLLLHGRYVRERSFVDTVKYLDDDLKKRLPKSVMAAFLVLS